jgi:hypothetical protein
VGFPGLNFLSQQRTSGFRHFAVPEEMRAYWILFGSVALTAFGSAYYHLAPDDARLMWDRLPMSLGFTALLAATVSERIRLTWGLKLLPLLVVIGAGSVVCWRWTGNLLPYTFVQYGSIAVILAIVISFRSRFTHADYIFGVLAFYAAAKASEALDATIYAFGHIVSGHSLKHVLAALAAWWLLRMLKLREPR